MLLLLGGAVYSLAQTFVALLRGSIFAALTAGGMTLFMAGAVATFAVTWFTSSARYADSGDTGTTLRINPSIVWCLAVTLCGGALGSASYVAFISRGVDQLPLATPGGESVNRYLMICLLIISLIGLSALLKRRDSGYLRLSPNGIESADIFQTRTARWRDIVDVTDSPDKRSRNPIGFILKDDKPIVVANADRYEPNFGALYWMVRHYWKHPELREELTDGRALERLHSEQFDAE